MPKCLKFRRVPFRSGGGPALELALLGATPGVLALSPAGLWATHSPLLTDLGLQLNWRLGQLTGVRGARALRSATARRFGLRSISAHPERVPAQIAVASAEDAVNSRHFREHFRRTRTLRFRGGAAIPADIPVRVVWGECDRVARARSSRRTGELPHHALVETWEDCGHMLVWDAPERVVQAALALPTDRGGPA